MGFLGFLNVYAMRVNLSVAIVAMVNSTDDSSGGKNSSDFNGTCPAPIKPVNSTDDNKIHGTTFDWDSGTQGLVLGCFFYGYVLTQIPGGRGAERFGGKWILGLGILLTSIFTILMPLAAKVDFRLLVATRIIEGLGEGEKDEDTRRERRAERRAEGRAERRAQRRAQRHAQNQCGTREFVLGNAMTGET